MAEVAVERSGGRQSWAWAALIVASAAAAVAGAYGLLPAPLRVVAVFWFVLVCPGMAVVRLLGVSGRLLEWTLAVAVSMALGVVVAQAMLFAERWTASGGVLALAAIAVIGTALQLALSRRR